MAGQPWLESPATRAVMAALEAAGGPGCARFVGGCVRNSLLGQPVDDIDTSDRALLALGMAGAVAPLTTAVLSSVDDRHTGTASGFNSAIARTGGLIATALGGAVVAASVVQLTEAFHTAALLAAFSAVTAGIIAFVTLGREHGRR